MSSFDSVKLIVGDVRQYFFDNGVIEQIQDIKRTVHRPQKSPDPVIAKDRAWERVPYFTVNGYSVLRDRDTGQFKCWYESWYADPPEIARQGVLYCTFSQTCYAESADGRHWVKPELDYYIENGRPSNVVLGREDFIKLESTFVFDDILETDPARRYKIMLDHYVTGRSLKEITYEIRSTRDGRDGLTDAVQVEMHCSPDGVTWTAAPELPRFGRHGNGLGDCYTITPDPDCGVYRLYTRAAGMESIHYDVRRPRTGSFFPPHFPHDQARMNKRRVFLSQSADLAHWSRPECILTPDADDDNLDDSYYGMVQFDLGEMRVGLLNVLHEVSNTMDVRLVYSRDGLTWRQADQRQAWLTTTADAWDCCMVNISAAPIAVGDEHYVFYGGAANRHDWWIMGRKEGLTVPEATDMQQVKYGLGLAKLRRDGFVSLDAGAVREGVIVTCTLRTEGHNLEINAACGPDGYIDVEITDPDEQVLPGLSRADCDRFRGDSTSARITWRDRSRIDHGGCLRVRLFMRNAALYTLRFVG